MFEARVEGADEVVRMLRRVEDRLNRNRRKLLLLFAEEVVGITKERYLTDEGRILGEWRTSRRTGRRYRVVISRGDPDKIGVITGRLRASFGTPKEAYRSGDAHFKIMGDDKVEIGTNVEYAKWVVRKKYDFAERGLRDGYNERLPVLLRWYITQALREV